MACISSCTYEPGDLIHESKPYVKTIRPDLWDSVCAGCLRSDVELKRCSSCKMVRYCGLICQKAAWKDHKLICPFLPRYVVGPHHFFVQMVGMLILKTKGKNWKSITDEVMGCRVSFDDLVYQHCAMLRMPWFRIVLKAIETSLKSFLGKENVPDEKQLIKLIAKVKCNYFGLGHGKTKFEVLFIGASKFDHSCVPNANYTFSGNNIQLFAIKKINKFEKVTISYCPMFSIFEASNLYATMIHEFGDGGCYCNDCLLPYGESLLTKIFDPIQAVPILEDTEAYLVMASLMKKFELPMESFSQERIKELLKKQEGILGDTNLSRIRLLALKCLLLDGDIMETRDELMILEKWVKLAWGENFEELIVVYLKLFEINMKLNDEESSNYYRKELIRLKTICQGEENAKKFLLNA